MELSGQCRLCCRRIDGRYVADTISLPVFLARYCAAPAMFPAPAGKIPAQKILTPCPPSCMLLAVLVQIPINKGSKMTHDKQAVNI